ncbi:MAG: chemotaxis protein CheX [Isosphaeraceae bacterium]
MAVLMAVTNKLEEAVLTIWTTMLGMEAVPAQLNTNDMKRLNSGLLTGCVQITGAWRGAVLVNCYVSLARKLAASMFGMSEHEVTSQDINDALGEITNMIGGSFKAFLPESSTLSLPVVIEGQDYFFQVLTSNQVAKLAFTCNGKPFHVTIQEDASRTAGNRVKIV